MKLVNHISITADRRPLTAVRAAVCGLPSAVVLLLVALAACQAVPMIQSQTAETWMGFLQGETLDVSAEVGGRVVNVAVDEGSIVQSGQPLVTLDDEIVKLRIEISDANVAAARAQLALLEAGARAEDTRRAETRVEQARTSLEAAKQALTDAEAIRANPQTLNALKAQAETRALAAKEQLIAAARQAEAADLEHRFWEEQVRQLWEGVDIVLPKGGRVHFDTPTQRLVFAQEEWSKAGNNAWKAWGEVTQAQANVTAADAALKDVADQIANSIALDARVNQARATRERAAAGLQAAEAALAILREGASPAQIQTARAALDQALAARATLDQDLARHQVNAPRAGVVTRVFYRAGETIAATIPLVRLSITGDLKLRVFVPMSALARIRLGGTATVVVPELSNATVTGTVIYVAERAEFSDRQAQTDSERNAQLIAVEITIKNVDGQLKAGMPASASFDAKPSTAITLPTIASSAGARSYAGTLEARQTRVAAELNGKVTAVRVNRGDMVKIGDTLITIDDSTVRANLNEAEAAARAAQSNLDQVQEKARAGTLALADASVATAQAELEAAQLALKDADRALANPQELNSQIHVWEGKVAAAQGEMTRAEATLAAVKVQVESAARDQSMAGKYRQAIMKRQQDAAEAGLRAAQVNLQGSQRALELYRGVLKNPLELAATQHAAANQVKITEAGVKVAQVERDIARRGGQAEAIAFAEARLRAAQAGLKLVQAQAKRYTLASPIDGTVVGRDAEVGATARPGAALLTIADTRELEMTVYVPLRDLGMVRVGQAVRVKLPSLPGKTFAGKVTFIAPEGEFKPANIYNSQERAEIVFAVRVTVPNPSDELKAGLPGDVVVR
jgi:HlyD family secretion protein